MKNDYSPSFFYRIRIKVRLDDRWLRRFEGLNVTQLPSGKTEISGEIIDQSALHGILARIRDLGLELISVQHSKTQNDPPI